MSEQPKSAENKDELYERLQRLFSDTWYDVHRATPNDKLADLDVLRTKGYWRQELGEGAKSSGLPEADINEVIERIITEKGDLLQ